MEDFMWPPTWSSSRTSMMAVVGAVEGESRRVARSGAVMREMVAMLWVLMSHSC